MNRVRTAAGKARHAVPAVLLHDLRTPLGQIIGYTELLVERVQESGDATLVPDLQKVGAAGYRMLALLEESFTSGGGAAAARNGGAPEPAGRSVRLADFIISDREAILAEWEAFARTCTPAAGSMDIPGLRDHAGEMLAVIAADLGTAQGSRAQAAKSKGNAPATVEAGPTAAEAHGADRAGSGFTIEQMVSEYRALRASVIRLWSRARGTLGSSDLEDLTRFNEAIDQSLAESVTRYTQELDDSKEMFLAILGHDLRTPIGAVLTSAQFMLDTGELKEPHLTLTRRIASSSGRMVHMVGALLDFTRSRLGGGIPIVRAPMNMGKTVHDVVDEICAANPQRTIRVDARGEQQGSWDCARISQALTNLVGNALEHGADGTVVTVESSGDADELTIAIHNTGRSIPAGRLSGIFHPMKSARAVTGPAGRGSSSGNLGLGLYIAERIITAHQGRIEVESSAARGTTFTVYLPRAG